jgi:hypothetical protein
MVCKKCHVERPSSFESSGHSTRRVGDDGDARESAWCPHAMTELKKADMLDRSFSFFSSLPGVSMVRKAGDDEEEEEKEGEDVGWTTVVFSFAIIAVLLCTFS